MAIDTSTLTLAAWNAETGAGGRLRAAIEAKGVSVEGWPDAAIGMTLAIAEFALDEVKTYADVTGVESGADTVNGGVD